MHVAWLGEPASLDATTVGGKTANLGRLATSFRVPPGFCLDVSAFDELRPALDGDAASRARLRELVATSYADLARRVGEREPRVAVRSSAIGEDSGDASFAGQHDTVLDVGGVDAIVDALLECWRSVYSDRAAAYRKQRGIAGTPRIAVLVQLMVPADASAIAFSADPVSGARDVVVVNAARGLGDAIASGTITPDSYTVRKRDLVITSRACADGGAVPDGDVAAIARLAIQLETIMGGPVDIECALRDGELHLLQCRPITSLAEEFPVTWDNPGDATLTWEREDSHFDRVLGPLAIEFIRNGPDYGIRKRFLDIGFPMLVRHAAFNGRFYVSSKPLVPAEQLPAKLTEMLALRRRVGRTLRARWDEEFLPELHAHYDWMRRLDLGAMTPAAAADAWLEIWRRLNRIWSIHFIVTGSSYPVMEELAQAYEQLVGRNGGEALVVTQGLAPSLQSLERGLYELADVTRRLPAVRDAITGGERSPDVLARLPGGDEFAGALREFLSRHGDVGQETLDVASAPWRDDPAKLLTMLAQRLGSGREHPDARAARVRTLGHETLARARAALAGRPEDLGRFEEVVAAALGAGPLTEEHNYWIDRVSQAHVRRLALAAGARLVHAGALDAADEVFLLYVPEIAEALRAPRPLQDLVARRGRELATWQRLKAPPKVGAPSLEPPTITPGVALERVDFEYAVTQDGTNVLKGVTASPGIARGPARLITDHGEFSKMREGDVLICRQSTASWVPLYTMAAAVVTELGGSLCHAAVVAREFGIPAVVAVGGALSTLSDGEPLEVDASAGTVRRLFPVTWKDPGDAKILWRRDDAHNTRVVTPLAIEYTRHGANYGMRRRDQDLGSPVLARLETFNGRSYSGTQALRPPNEIATHQKETLAKRRSLARRVRRDWDDRYLPELNEHYAWMRSLSVDGLSGQEASAAWDDLWQRHRRAWRIHILVTSAAYAVMDELGETYQALIGGSQADALALTQGLALTLQQLERDLYALTEAARKTPAAAEAIGRASTLDELRSRDATFGRAVDEFLRVHGEAGASGDHFGSVAWADDPTLLIRAIGQRLVIPAMDPDVRRAGLRKRADEIAAHARKALADRPEDLARFEEVVATACATGPLTEEHNYWLDRRNHANLGKAARTFGARLVRDHVIRDREQIFLLYLDEVRDALREPRDLSPLIAEREKEQSEWRRLEAPETLGQPDAGLSAKSGPIWHLLYREAQDDPTRALRGAPASAGIARGPARLVRNLEEFAKFQRGDVLVCQSSNVSWIPLFTSAAAVVTEVGGPLSHAAVVAREFAIPAVVGTSVALSTLVDGEPLEVDGSAGIVRRLSA
jgi:phosphoenolpyruvate synthase/pyruvate phosphate dikinase